MRAASMLRARLSCGQCYSFDCLVQNNYRHLTQPTTDQRKNTMSNQTLSRRSFSKFLAAGAAYAALQPPIEARSAPSFNNVVRLRSNENPYGPSPAALKAMTDGFSLAWRYPDEYAEMLAEELARLHDVPVNQIVLGDGSGEILKLCAAAFTSRDKKL